MSSEICRECGEDQLGHTGWCPECAEHRERQRVLAIIALLRTELAHCSVRWAFDRLVEKINETTDS